MTEPTCCGIRNMRNTSNLTTLLSGPIRWGVDREGGGVALPNPF